MRVVAITADTSLTVTLAMMDDWEVVSAHDVDQAAEAAGFAAVGLIGLGETDEGLAIVEQLSARGVSIPFIVVGDRPAPFGTRVTVLTRPFSLDDLRAAVDQALTPVVSVPPAGADHEATSNGAAGVVAEESVPPAPPPVEDRSLSGEAADIDAPKQTEAPAPMVDAVGEPVSADLGIDVPASSEEPEPPPTGPAAEQEPAAVEDAEPPAGEAERLDARQGTEDEEPPEVVRLPEVPPEPEPPMPGLPESDLPAFDVPDLPMPADAGRSRAEPLTQEPQTARVAVAAAPDGEQDEEPLDARLVAVRRAAKVPTGVEATLLERLRAAFAAVTDLEELVEMLPVLGDPGALAESVLTEMMRDFEPETAFVAERAAEGYRVVSARGLSSVERDLVMNAEQPLLAAASGVPRGVLVETVALASDLVDGVNGVCTEALMAAPLSVEGRTVGVLVVGRDRLDAADVEKLLTLALEAAPGFAIAQMIDRLRRG